MIHSLTQPQFIATFGAQFYQMCTKEAIKTVIEEMLKQKNSNCTGITVNHYTFTFNEEPVYAVIQIQVDITGCVGVAQILSAVVSTDEEEMNNVLLDTYNEMKAKNDKEPDKATLLIL